jgi:hypothetical protein
MNYKKSIILFVFLIGLLANCEYKPKKYNNFFPEEEQETILLGLLYRQNLTLTNYGTAKDASSGLEWKRCSQGQGFRLAENDCRGVISGTLTNPIDSGRFGAVALTFCNIPTMDCNKKSLPFELTSSTTGVSEAYNSCNSDRTGNFSDWRVPTPQELVAFASGGKNVLYDIFSSTVQDYYWSSYGNEKDPTATTAYVVSFAQDKWGELDVKTKDARYYVRCVRKF